jgi:hypothetical protein
MARRKHNPPAGLGQGAGNTSIRSEAKDCPRPAENDRAGKGRWVAFEDERAAEACRAAWRDANSPKGGQS